MELRVFVEPQQGASYLDQLEVARATEEAGLDGFFRSDHYLRIAPLPGNTLPGPSDAWVTLAGLARETTRIRLGTLVTAATFRLPGPLAIAVAEVDAMSGGRVELGLGAGWFEEEHRAYGIPFPTSVAERFDRLEEQLEIVTGLWSADVDASFSFSGKHYTLTDSPGLPKPLQRPGPPVIIGGRGTRRTPGLAARFGSECNVGFGTDEQVGAVFEALDRACGSIGRDPGEVVRSVALVCCCAETEEGCARRAAAIGSDLGRLRREGLAGSPEEIAERLGSLARLGVSRVYLQMLDLADLDQIRLIGQALSPLVTSL